MRPSGRFGESSQITPARKSEYGRNSNRLALAILLGVFSGSAMLTDKDRASQTFKAGGSFLIPKGTKCIWEIAVTLRKFYMIAA